MLLNNFTNRLKILRNLVFVALAIITVRLFFIQIIEHDDWVARANEEHTILETITAKRGEIYMMDKGEPVSIVKNQTSYQIIIDPAVTEKDKIEAALNESAKDYITVDLEKVYSIEGSRYAVVAKNVPRDAALKIADKDISSVWFQSNNQRFYPEGELASSLLGFVNADGLGQYGVEGSLNELLAGKDGLLKTTADINKIALSIGDDNIKIPAEDGKDVVLTIDRGLEKGVEEIAAEHINNTDATNAAVLILNANTNEVLAMADLPNYNPADYGNVVDASAYLNHVTEDPYEPASICKSFTFSAAINEGVMDSETTYFNEGYEIIDGQQIFNAERRSSIYGEINMRTALYWSLNTGSIYALKLLGGDTENINATGREKLYDYYYNNFRLGQYTNIELIENPGFIWDPHANIYGLNAAYANMTFGQNLSLTMIQTATAFSAVVNGGYYRTPTILKGTLENGELVKNEREDVVEDKILSDATSAEMRDMLINNRNYKITGGIDRDGYNIGGKSGTAQAIVDGAYDDTMNVTVGSYIGFIAKNGGMPEYVIMVRMWGDEQHLDGAIAGQLFDDISNYVIDYFKIQPNY